MPTTIIISEPLFKTPRFSVRDAKKKLQFDGRRRAVGPGWFTHPQLTKKRRQTGWLADKSPRPARRQKKDSCDWI